MDAAAIKTQLETEFLRIILGPRQRALLPKFLDYDALPSCPAIGIPHATPFQKLEQMVGGEFLDMRLDFARIPRSFAPILAQVWPLQLEIIGEEALAAVVGVEQSREFCKYRVTYAKEGIALLQKLLTTTPESPELP